MYPIIIDEDNETYMIMDNTPKKRKESSSSPLGQSLCQSPIELSRKSLVPVFVLGRTYIGN